MEVTNVIDLFWNVESSGELDTNLSLSFTGVNPLLAWQNISFINLNDSIEICIFKNKIFKIYIFLTLS